MESSLWGDVPTWIASVGSLLALVFTAVAVRFAHRTYQIESERDRVNADSRKNVDLFARRAQAALVSAWWGKSPDGTWGTFVRNASETPIYQVYVTVLAADDHSDGAKFNQFVVPPAGEPIFLTSDHVSSETGDRRVKISFTDAAGLRWLRNQYGKLTELEPTLTVLADSVRSEALFEFKEDFQATYGVTASFLAAPNGYDSQEQFIEQLMGPGPVDAVICPHDWIGELVARDAIEPTILSAEHLRAFPEWALAALTIGGTLYGLPTTLDTVVLFRNTTLAPDPPDTFEDLICTGTALRERGAVTEVLSVRVGSRGDPFQIWPLFTGAGGWLFARCADGTWDPTRIGLASPESVAAFEVLRSLGEAGLGILRSSVNAQDAKDAFVNGRSAYLISTSDALAPIRNSGLPVHITPVPPFAGRPRPEAFSLVHGLVMAKRGPGKIIAHDLFADYLTHSHVIVKISESCDAPAALHGMTHTDIATQQFLRVCEQGRPMPSFPQMNATWRILEAAELAVVAGEPAGPAAQRAAERMREIYPTAP